MAIPLESQIPKVHLPKLPPNEKGDLFTARMCDVIHALGYVVESTNIAKAGRELDVVARHRYENARLIGECKAQVDTVGGADINKFVGVLDAEKDRGVDIRGYFISISGFKATAVAQEEATGRHRCSLLGPHEILTSLVGANLISTPADAALQVRKLVPSDLEVVADPDLIMSRRGWLYVFQAKRGGDVVGFALTHSSGRPLTVEEARSELDQVSTNSTAFVGEVFGSPPPVASDAAAKLEYIEYLQREFGVIRHEGLPLDAEYGAGAPVRLTDLYVRQRLEPIAQKQPTLFHASSEDPAINPEALDVIPESALNDHNSICVLGPPGSGKSTLIKHLATSTPAVIGTNILPLVIRCRELPINWKNFTDIVSHIPRVAELQTLGGDFCEMVNFAADSGNLLLLVDGLDEIIDPAARRRFATQLRTYLGRHPEIKLVITSREAGYRLIADAIAEYAERFRICELSREDIVQLTQSWFSHIHGTSAVAERQAGAIAAAICNDWRLRRLASTPLLLTMLLLIQRWSGGTDLPKRRAVLYRRSIEVLVSTWNVEAHLPINMDEALPQLAYAAFRMTAAGQQRVSSRRLTTYVNEARAAMPDVLGFVKESSAEFLTSIEARSSLIIQSGFDDDDGELLPAIEFRHRVFQDYLAALAIVQGWCSGEVASPESIVAAVRPHFPESAWFEIVELVSVLASRNGSLVLDALHQSVLDYSEQAEGIEESDDADTIFDKGQSLARLLCGCLGDDAQTSPERARILLETLCWALDEPVEYTNLLDSRYNEVFRSVVDFGIDVRNDANYVSAASCVFLHDNKGLDEVDYVKAVTSLLLDQTDARAAVGYYVLMTTCYEGSQPLDFAELPVLRDSALFFAESFLDSVIATVCELGSGFRRTHAVWCIAWMLEHHRPSSDRLQQLIVRLVDILLTDLEQRARHFAGWILAKTLTKSFRLNMGDMTTAAQLNERVAGILATTDRNQGRNEDAGIIVVSYYFGLETHETVLSILKDRYSWLARNL